jgi:hypothetical protein
MQHLICRQPRRRENYITTESQRKKFAQVRMLIDDETWELLDPGKGLLPSRMSSGRILTKSSRRSRTRRDDAEIEFSSSTQNQKEA